MKEDRLRKDKSEIHNLDDLIEARSERTSHISADTDAFEEDIDIPEDIDVDEALTFPHPKHKKTVDIELMDTPNEDDMDEDWDAQDIQPSDYSHGYDEATTTSPRDDEEEDIEEAIDEAGHVTMRDISEEPELEVMPNKFAPDKETEA